MIYFLGDSHVSFFSGQNYVYKPFQEIISTIPFFKPYTLGAVAAYNLIHYKNKIEEILKEIPKESTIGFIFGEIDCRVYLLNVARKENISVAEAIKVTIDRYIDILTWVKSKGFKVIVFGATYSIVKSMTAQEKKKAGEYIILNSFKDRKKITDNFNIQLNMTLQTKEIDFINLTDLIDHTDESNYIDPIHISQKVMPKIKKLL